LNDFPRVCSIINKLQSFNDCKHPVSFYNYKQMLINQSILIFSHNRKVLSSLSNIRDKTVLITGASRGIGKQQQEN
jgi:hypothetical protein